MLKIPCETEIYCFCSNNVCAILLTLIDETVTDCIATFKLLYQMDKMEIGLNAGKVWQLLSDSDKWSYGKLKKKSGLEDRELGAALGWLAREDKIEFEQQEDDLYVFLCVNVYIG